MCVLLLRSDISLLLLHSSVPPQYLRARNEQEEEPLSVPFAITTSFLVGRFLSSSLLRGGSLLVLYGLHF